MPDKEESEKVFSLSWGSALAIIAVAFLLIGAILTRYLGETGGIKNNIAMEQRWGLANYSFNILNEFYDFDTGSPMFKWLLHQDSQAIVTNPHPKASLMEVISKRNGTYGTYSTYTNNVIGSTNNILADGELPLIAREKLARSRPQ